MSGGATAFRILTLAGLCGCWITKDDIRDWAGSEDDTAAATDTGTTDTDTLTFDSYTTAWGSVMVEMPEPPVTFVMGGGSADPDDDYLDHEVTLTHRFWIGRTEVTQAQWLCFSASNPSTFATCALACPVEQVSWQEAALYANALSDEEGLERCYEADGSDLLASLGGDPYACAGYRLPTEAEWEYAARAGEDTRYAGSDATSDVAWIASNSSFQTHDVGLLAANGRDLRDMSGNVWEWTNDRYLDGYYEISPESDPAGPSRGSMRTHRGGAWDSSAREASVALRRWWFPEGRDDNLGFRLARSEP